MAKEERIGGKDEVEALRIVVSAERALELGVTDDGAIVAMPVDLGRIGNGKNKLDEIDAVTMANVLRDVQSGVAVACHCGCGVLVWDANNRGRKYFNRACKQRAYRMRRGTLVRSCLVCGLSFESVSDKICSDRCRKVRKVRKARLQQGLCYVCGVDTSGRELCNACRNVELGIVRVV